MEKKCQCGKNRGICSKELTAPFVCDSVSGSEYESEYQPELESEANPSSDV
jgi:hypothetical protein